MATLSGRAKGLRARAALPAALLAAALAGCSRSHNTDAATPTAINGVTTATAALLPGGPAATGAALAVTFGDRLIQSDTLNVLIGSAARGANPQTAPTAGALLDLAVNGAANDQLALMTQSVLGLKLTGTTTPPAAPNNPADNPVVWTSVNVVDLGDGSAAVRCTGVLLETSTSTPGSGTFIGAAISTVIPGLTGLPVVVGATSTQPLSIQTTYSVRGGDPFLRIDSQVSCGAGDSINIFSIADLLIKFDQVSSTTINAFNPISGPQALGLAQQVVVPFVNHFNTDVDVGPPLTITGTSYTHFDPFFGMEIHASASSTEPLLVSLMAEVPLAGVQNTRLTATNPSLWTRFMSAGAKGDVASSADVALARIAESQALRGVGPNPIGAVAAVAGTVTGAPAGAQVLLIQNDPAVLFNPLTGSYQPSPVPDPVLQTTPPSGPGVLVYSAGTIGADGSYSVTVPVDFDARVPASFGGPSGSLCTYYALVVSATFTPIDTVPAAAVVGAGEVVNFQVVP